MDKTLSGAAGALGKVMCLGMLALALAGPAGAKDSTSGKGAVQRGLVVTKTVKFDWLKAPAATLNVAQLEQNLKPTQVVARGAYVCSPAGFGRRSQCFAR
ncbi:hypothetical protein [Phaeovulum sp. W22_SRMD_FR3]|uniref:hypothetical protein n=1 Tax=Phaeovulum sp. W22_SRMD_FR3 TaxID=3240274 RepID=UPI003F9B113A